MTTHTSTPQSSSREAGEPPTHLGELVDYVEDHYHAPLRFDLGMLTALLDVCAAIAPSDARLVKACVAFEGFRHDVLEHLRAEERGVFRLIRGENPESSTVTSMSIHAHHGYLGEQLALVAELVGGHAPDPSYAAPWTRFVQKLKVVLEEFGRHTTLETDVLFPRALEAGLISEGFEPPGAEPRLGEC